MEKQLGSSSSSSMHLQKNNMAEYKIPLSEVWMRAYLVAAKDPNIDYIETAVYWADGCLEAYKKRFEKDEKK